jgi:cytochrome P450
VGRHEHQLSPGKWIVAVSYNPFDERNRDDPYPLYAALRQEAPVYWAEEAEAWVVSRHDDVEHILKHPELFSSDAMRTMLMSFAGDPRSDPEAECELFALAEALPFDIEDIAQARMLLTMDPPDHGWMRSIVNRGFTPRRIEGWEGRIRELVEDAFGRFRDRGEFDLMADLAIPLPVIVISEMLGVEPGRRADFKRWSNVLVAGATGSTKQQGLVRSGFVGAMGEFCEYFDKVIAERRQEPQEDLISTLVRAEQGEALKPMDAAMFTLLLLVAGNETTTNLIGNAVNALLDHPDQLELVRNDLNLVPALVEETLRYDCPVQFVFRRAQQPVVIAGQTVDENSIVMPLIGSANRDAGRFDRADEFDIRRSEPGHIGFGFGAHFCLGASLARLEARVALERLVEELPRLTRREARTQYVDSFLLRGPRKLRLAYATH